MKPRVADGPPMALLAGSWERRGMLARTKSALGKRTVPKWLPGLVDVVLDYYRDAPADRPRELAAFLQTTEPWRKAWTGRRPPQIVALAPVPTSIVTHPWPVALLPDRAALTGLLDLDQGELDWFADVRGWERHVAEPLRHYRWTTLPKRDGPSISAGRVWSLLRTAGLPEPVAYTVTGLATTVAPSPYRPHDARLTRPHLPQGAPTSPAIANLVAFSLDRRLAGLAARFDARYTRYVDDLTFSGGPSLRSARSRFVALVAEIVADDGFRVNERKTVVLGDAGRQALLGTVVNHHATLPRPERDALRALLHNCSVLGWRSQVRGQDDLRAHVLGRIAWVGGLDPILGRRLRENFDAIDWS